MLSIFSVWFLISLFIILTVILVYGSKVYSIPDEVEKPCAHTLPKNINTKYIVFSNPIEYFDIMSALELENERIRINSRFVDEYFKNHEVYVYSKEQVNFTVRTDKVTAYCYKYRNLGYRAVSEFIFDSNTKEFLEYRFYLIRDVRNIDVVAFTPKFTVLSTEDYGYMCDGRLANMCLSVGIYAYIDYEIGSIAPETSKFLDRIESEKKYNPSILTHDECVDNYFDESHLAQILLSNNRGKIVKSSKLEDIISIPDIHSYIGNSVVVEDTIIKVNQTGSYTILEYRVHIFSYSRSEVVFQLPKKEFEFNYNEFRGRLRYILRSLGVVTY